MKMAGIKHEMNSPFAARLLTKLCCKRNSLKQFCCHYDGETSKDKTEEQPKNAGLLAYNFNHFVRPAGRDG